LPQSHAETHHRRQGRSEDLTLLVDVANRIEGHTICALGDAAAWPVQSFVKHLPSRVPVHGRAQGTLDRRRAGAAAAADAAAVAA